MSEWGLPLNAGAGAPYGMQVSPASKRLAALMATAESRAQEEYEQGPGRKAAAAMAAGEICCSEEVKKERKKKSAYITRYRQKHYECLLEQAVQEGEGELAAKMQERARCHAEVAQLRQLAHQLAQQVAQQVAQQQQAAAAAAAAAEMETRDVAQQQNERFVGSFLSKLDNPAFEKFYLSEDEQAAIQEYYTSSCASEAA